MTYLSCFFFNDTATTEIYTYLHTLSLHDALPIYCLSSIQPHLRPCRRTGAGGTARHLGNGVRAPGRLSSRPARWHLDTPVAPVPDQRQYLRFRRADLPSSGIPHLSKIGRASGRESVCHYG